MSILDGHTHSPPQHTRTVAKGVEWCTPAWLPLSGFLALWTGIVLARSALLWTIALRVVASQVQQRSECVKHTHSWLSDGEHFSDKQTQVTQQAIKLLYTPFYGEGTTK